MDDDDDAAAARTVSALRALVAQAAAGGRLAARTTTLQPLVERGSVKPVLLQGMMIVEAFIIHVCLSARGNTLPAQLFGYSHGGSESLLAPLVLPRGSCTCTAAMATASRLSSSNPRAATPRAAHASDTIARADRSITVAVSGCRGCEAFRCQCAAALTRSCAHPFADIDIRCRRRDSMRMQCVILAASTCSTVATS